jgi:hypothetical protein
MRTSYISVILLLVGLGFLISCDTMDPGTTGNFVLYLTDAPGEFDEVNIVVESVALHKADAGWITINNESRSFDLLKLTNGVTAVLGEATLDAGRYTEIRLMIGNGSNVVMEGEPYSLQIPSGIQTGLKLVQTFEIEPDYTYELLFDLDAHRSVHQVGLSDVYILQPAYRLQSMATSGSIAGNVQPGESRAVVTVYRDGELITTTYADETSGDFKVIHLPEGNYSLHFGPREEGFSEYTMNGVTVNVGETKILESVNLE